MAYSYDLFFSYKRHPESDQWHQAVRDKLEHWVSLELGRPVSIFFDREDVRTGMRFRDKLAEALKHSRCMICVWSPLYFQSQWCLSEWKTFDARSRMVGRDLVIAASYFDGENFPPEARQVQFSDFSPFASTVPSFWISELALQFETGCLKPFCRDVARSIRNAPPFDDRFPVVEAPAADVQPEPTIGRPANG